MKVEVREREKKLESEIGRETLIKRRTACDFKWGNMTKFAQYEPKRTSRRLQTLHKHCRNDHLKSKDMNSDIQNHAWSRDLNPLIEKIPKEFISNKLGKESKHDIYQDTISKDTSGFIQENCIGPNKMTEDGQIFSLGEMICR